MKCEKKNFFFKTFSKILTQYFKRTSLLLGTKKTALCLLDTHIHVHVHTRTHLVTLNREVSFKV